MRDEVFCKLRLPLQNANLKCHVGTELGCELKSRAVLKARLTQKHHLARVNLVHRPYIILYNLLRNWN
jgi:hypothetical protein